MRFNEAMLEQSLQSNPESRTGLLEMLESWQVSKIVLGRGETDRVIMMAWEDRTSFDAIRDQFGLTPGEVIKLMRREMDARSFRLWRRRTRGRVTKHEAKFSQTEVGREPRRFRAKSQRG